jgi:hypothetical protein
VRAEIEVLGVGSTAASGDTESVACVFGEEKDRAGVHANERAEHREEGVSDCLALVELEGREGLREEVDLLEGSDVIGHR